MQYFAVIIVAALVFGVCYLFDKGFDKAFRNKAQHKSGLAVRPNKRYAAFGAIMIALGTAAIFASAGNTLLLLGGFVVLIIAIGLIVYYTTFGIFYDEDSFIFTSFGKKSVEYRYGDIQSQQLYVIQGGNTLIELHMADGNSVSVQSAMLGVYAFLDTAFAGWCRQKGINSDDCAFYDPANSCWFPGVEEN